MLRMPAQDAMIAIPRCGQIVELEATRAKAEAQFSVFRDQLRSVGELFASLRVATRSREEAAQQTESCHVVRFERNRMAKQRLGFVGVTELLVSQAQMHKNPGVGGIQGRGAMECLARPLE